jgi:protein SCO1/2
MNHKLLTSIFLFFLIISCDNNKIRQQVKNDNQLSLPFFNKSDWTPEWINKTESNYQLIHKIPNFSFLDQKGNIVSDKTVKGKIHIANFFFTTCRGICPKMTSNMQLLQAAFNNDTSVLFLSYSVAPEVDNIEVLNKYAFENKVNSKQWHLLTGPKNEIYNLAKKQYFAGDSIGYYQTGNEFLHTENFILIDKQMRIRGVYNGTLLVEIERIKEDIAILKQEN